MGITRVRTIQAYPKGATCNVGQCNRKPYGRGWCQLHYGRWRSHGDPLGYAGPKHVPMPVLQDKDLGWCAGILEGERMIEKLNAKQVETAEKS